MSNFNQLTDQQLLDLVHEKMNEFKTKQKIKTFFKVMRITLNVEWAGSREIYFKFRNTNYETWMSKHGCNSTSQESLINLTGKDRVLKFVEALHGEYKPDEDKKMGRNITAMVQEWLERNGTDTIAELITREAEKLRPIVVQVNGGSYVKVDGILHKKFERVLKLVVRERQVFIAGPAGTGKTTLAAQVAKALEVQFKHISCTAGMSEAHLLGRMDAHGNYIKTDFVDCYENGGVFLFDEVDAADSNTMLIINSALANGHLSVPNRKDNGSARRHEKFYCICAANTWGYGSSDYSGRNVLDNAFLDRFVGSRVRVEYDIEMEEKIAGDYKNLLHAIWKIRQNVFDSRIKRIVSTRAIVSGVRSLMDGEDLSFYIKETFMEGWTDQEIAKALTNVSLN